MDTIKDNSKSNTKTTSRLRRFAIGTVAAVAGLGLAGAGTAAAATPATDTAPAVETEVANEVAYEVFGGLVELPTGQKAPIVGGHILTDGTGVFEVWGFLGTEYIEVTNSTITQFGGFLAVNYGGMQFGGPLVAEGFYLYDAELVGGWDMEIGIESLMLVPTNI